MGKAWQKCWNAMNYLYGTLQTGSRKRLRAYKNCHSGRCFIIGNGPSLKNVDLKRIMELGEVGFKEPNKMILIIYQIILIIYQIILIIYQMMLILFFLKLANSI